jgi:hypothetical protein
MGWHTALITACDRRDRAAVRAIPRWAASPRDISCARSTRSAASWAAVIDRAGIQFRML